MSTTRPRPLLTLTAALLFAGHADAQQPRPAIRRHPPLFRQLPLLHLPPEDMEEPLHPLLPQRQVGRLKSPKCVIQLRWKST